ncbi:ATP-binding protein [Kaistella sp. G5-32]|uniref:ATP-binding protein n=1 Tax=Kaistella gelatinilytica TaxID=2787636 RepID=A0ABS0FBS2_9FLAO|nr:histidine kinase [Kaistella gelatinilytica]MBF8457160.1 ATP-binding protein [Kaistella gelatinilytica]
MRALPVEIKFSIIIAILLMVIIVVFLIFIIVLYYRRQMIFSKEERLKEMEYRTQLLQQEIDYRKKMQSEHDRVSHDLHDDLGSGITALKLQTQFIKQKTTDIKISQNIEELLQTCDELNVSMRQILWNLKVGDDNLENFAQRISHYAKNFFAKTNIKVHIFKEEVGYDHISADTRRNLYLCIKEALNNVYKHSNSENVEVHFNRDGKIFTVDIKDDGVGITPDAAYGDGIENMKSRMVALCGNLNFVPSEKGLHVRLNLDLQNDQDSIKNVEKV